MVTFWFYMAEMYGQMILISKHKNLVLLIILEGVVINYQLYVALILSCLCSVNYFGKTVTEMIRYTL
jgi:hypothetical protein